MRDLPHFSGVEAIYFQSLVISSNGRAFECWLRALPCEWQLQDRAYDLLRMPQRPLPELDGTESRDRWILKGLHNLPQHGFVGSFDV